MMGTTYTAWLKTGLDAWSLSTEAASVVGLRMMKMAAGGSAGSAEAALMVSEKVQAGLELQAMMLGAGPWQTPLARTQRTLRHYRGKVAANRRRLVR